LFSVPCSLLSILLSKRKKYISNKKINMKEFHYEKKRNH
jgi:hypothetical protein